MTTDPSTMYPFLFPLPPLGPPLCQSYPCSMTDHKCGLSLSTRLTSRILICHASPRYKQQGNYVHCMLVQRSRDRHDSGLHESGSHIPCGLCGHVLHGEHSMPCTKEYKHAGLCCWTSDPACNIAQDNADCTVRHMLSNMPEYSLGFCAPTKQPARHQYICPVSA